MRYDVNYWVKKKEKLFEKYNENYSFYKNILTEFIEKCETVLKENNINGSVKGRIKNFDVFHKKILLKCQKERIKNPIESITDLIGARIIVPFLEDVDLVEKLLQSKFTVIEVEHKSQALSIREFGYDSTHLLITIDQKIKAGKPVSETDGVVEVQIRTTLQDAWAEVEHELIYKTSIDKVEDTIRRKLTAVNASLTLADITFQEIRDHHNQKFKELQIKHKRLLDKVSTIPEKFPQQGIAEDNKNSDSSAVSDQSLDKLYKDADSKFNNLLLEAINAHVSSEFTKAIDLYTQLLVISPSHFLYNHRGLVYIAVSEYNKAIEDFTMAIELEPKDLRVYTNRGMALRLVSKHREALSDFNKSLELNPLWPDTLYGRALSYYELGDIAKSLEDCEKALAINPKFKQASRFKQFLLNIAID